MTKTYRMGTALAAVSIIALASACSGPSSSRSRTASIFGDKVDKSNVGLATRAQVLLSSNDVKGATELAERAVENTPNDAGFRALLGNCYLAGGRFQSAEAAYKDSLQLVANQPQVIVKLALVQSALGKKNEAAQLLEQSQSVLDPTDLGLALALAGRPDVAIQVLDAAARQPGADSRTRQNLALAHAFQGDWDSARLIASQDLAADQVDARIQQWMALSKPAHESDQVASFIGIQPTAADPGQPVRLALNKGKDEVRYAAAEPMPSSTVTEGLGNSATVDVAEAVPAEAPQDVAVAVAEPVSAPEPAPVVMAQADPNPAPVFVPASAPAPAPALSPAVAKVTAPVRRAAVARPVKAGSAVVQLGAYSSRDRISVAWNKALSKFNSLRGYTPVSARYEGANGTYYRLSVKGFGSAREAQNFCSNLKKSGRPCFVRTVSGDAPIQMASR